MNILRAPAWNMRAQRRWPASGAIWTVVVVLALIGLVVGLLIATGVIRLGTAEFAPPEGKVAVPISPVELPAFRRLSVDDLVQRGTGRIAVLYFDPEHVRPEMITDLSRIAGRVLRRNKPAGFAFTERDFLPAGTRPGLPAGIPPGKRAMRIQVSQVGGLEDLAVGDRFDLVATLPLDSRAIGRAGGVGAIDTDALGAGLAGWGKQATVEVVVQNGIVVAPMTTRAVPVSVNSLTQGALTRTRPVQEVVVAVAPEEVAQLTRAIAVGAQVQAVIRSGHPDDPADSETPAYRPRFPFAGAGGDYTFIETISGNDRRYVAVSATHVPGRLSSDTGDATPVASTLDPAADSPAGPGVDPGAVRSP